jgi:hypothetical protein
MASRPAVQALPAALALALLAAGCAGGRPLAGQDARPPAAATVPAAAFVAVADHVARGAGRLVVLDTLRAEEGPGLPAEPPTGPPLLRPDVRAALAAAGHAIDEACEGARCTFLTLRAGEVGEPGAEPGLHRIRIGTYTRHSNVHASPGSARLAVRCPAADRCVVVGEDDGVHGSIHWGIYAAYCPDPASAPAGLERRLARVCALPAVQRLIEEDAARARDGVPAPPADSAAILETAGAWLRDAFEGRIRLEDRYHCPSGQEWTRSGGAPCLPRMPQPVLERAAAAAGAELVSADSTWIRCARVLEPGNFRHTCTMDGAEHLVRFGTPRFASPDEAALNVYARSLNPRSRPMPLAEWDGEVVLRRTGAGWEIVERRVHRVS